MKKISICTILILLLCVSAHAAGVGRVTYCEGRVDRLTANSQDATPLREGDAISVGDAVRTKSNSKAEIAFDDGSVLRIAQNSKVAINDYKLDKDNRRVSAAIKLERGKMRSIIAKMPDGAEFNIATPNADGAVKGSDIFAYYQAGSSGMLVAEGRLSVANPAQPQEVKVVPAGSSVLVSLEEAPAEPRPYLELERKLHEEDTNIPFVPKREKTSVIRGVVAGCSGAVKITEKRASASHNAKLNEIVSEGDKIETGDDGKVEIRLDNGNAISLKSNSNITLVKLSMDLKTGDYENRFESSMGRIKARIESLGAKSTFEVKTPTAVSGARGTIMYLDIMQNLTKSFFEGGAGYLASMVSGLSKDIASGENAQADNIGAISNPVPTTQEERLSFTDGWDTKSGVEGYSAPDGSAGGDLDMGAGDTGSIGQADIGGAVWNFFVNLPFETTSTSGEAALTPEEAFDYAGMFEGAFGYYDTNDDELDFDSGSMEGLFTGTGSLWSSPRLTAFVGRYYNPDDYYNLWGADLSGTGSDGTSIMGTWGGTSLPDGSLGAVLFAIYIRPDGSTGYISASDIMGIFDFDPEFGIWTFGAAGNLAAYLMGQTSILPEELNNNKTIFEHEDFYAGVEGDISGAIKGELINLKDQNWGLWRSGLGGEFDGGRPPQDDWLAFFGIGSLGVDGAGGFLYSTITGDTWSVEVQGRGKLFGKAEGAVLDYDKLMILEGVIIGSHSDGEWQALGIGAYTENDLKFLSKVDTKITDDGDEGGFFYAGLERQLFGLNGGQAETDNGQILIKDGNLSALMGGTRSLWSGSSPVTIIGRYDSHGNSPSYIWMAGIDSWNYVKRNHTTYDGGAYCGFISGVQRNPMAGLGRALYIDNAGRAGYLKGNFSGVSSSDLGMFMMDGELEAIEMSQNIGILPEDLRNSIKDSTELTGTGSGSFKDGGSIEAEMEGSSMSIIHRASNTEEKWGIMGAALFGSYRPPAAQNPSPAWTLDLAGLSSSEDDFRDSSWLGRASGSLWANHVFKGNYKGIFLAVEDEGTIKGGIIASDIVGNYIDVDAGDAGTWQAVTGGEWVDVDETLDLADLNNEIIRLGQAAGISITEVHPDLIAGIQGQGAFNCPDAVQNGIHATMDVNFYATQEAALQGVWAAIISGTYTLPTDNSWQANFESDAASVTSVRLDGREWKGGKWQADVIGQTTNGIQFQGGAAGTYDQTTFSGAGTGTWEKSETAVVPN